MFPSLVQTEKLQLFFGHVGDFKLLVPVAAIALRPISHEAVVREGGAQARPEHLGLVTEIIALGFAVVGPQPVRPTFKNESRACLNNSVLRRSPQCLLCQADSTGPKRPG